ncbi:MAG: HAD family phosphatase [Bacteroidales bacterium]
MIKNIIFDLGGVLVSLSRRKCLDTFSNALGFKSFGDYLNTYAQKGFFAEFEDGAIDSDGFRWCVKQYSLNKDITNEQIDDALCAFLTEVKSSKVQLLLQLKEKYNLYLLSNTNPIAMEYAKVLFKKAGGVPMEDVFIKMFLSFEMQKSKPGKAIFEQVLDETKIKPYETLFVDDADVNIDTAKEMGFKTLLYNVSDDLTIEVTEALK